MGRALLNIKEMPACVRNRRAMKRFLLALTLVFGVAAFAPAANIVIMTVEDADNYDAPNTLRDFAEKELKPLGIKSPSCRETGRRNTTLQD